MFFHKLFSKKLLIFCDDKTTQTASRAREERCFVISKKAKVYFVMTEPFKPLLAQGLEATPVSRTWRAEEQALRPRARRLLAGFVISGLFLQNSFFVFFKSL